MGGYRQIAGKKLSNQKEQMAYLTTLTSGSLTGLGRNW